MSGNRKEKGSVLNKTEITSCRHPKAFSGHSFAICFTASKPPKDPSYSRLGIGEHNFNNYRKCLENKT